jgi:hypothetical protein
MIQGCYEHCFDNCNKFLKSRKVSYIKSLLRRNLDVVSITGPMINPEGKIHLNIFYN